MNQKGNIFNKIIFVIKKIILRSRIIKKDATKGNYIFLKVAFN